MNISVFDIFAPEMIPVAKKVMLTKPLIIFSVSEVVNDMIRRGIMKAAPVQAWHKKFC
jgi:hypothetical protein